ncbi:ABC transporter ATP-binding protein [Anaerobium acetethylicum]|uniref:Branched-chain amino acid transport system ATP-binding protein n=1 Tax=Anaerobium acetethylicum TaxID=1619234 RepID=A0A1D3TYE2_9FIRM|nr:ABC transporter ATP-binding protein [Anaerobium acetethylicum]SCP99455.1 branched-chain amino acid transport system ATP-binding protein [Anaerobium acetethylicum]
MGTLLDVNDLSISFGGIKAVQNLNFHIDTGEVLALIGPNGSGKSTTVNMIAGIYIPDKGIIKYDGHVIPNKMDIANRAKLGIARTFQTPRPFANLTVYDNIYTIALLHNKYTEAKEITNDILKLTKLDNLRNTNSGKLSIEKRKWLDLARTMATRPKLIMMDEVMAGLNPAEMEASLDLIRAINKEGITVLFIEHVMKAVVSVCTRAIVLNQGKLLCEGEPREVLNNPDVVAAYLGGETDVAGN